jgi:hypothetical protein
MTEWSSSYNARSISPERIASLFVKPNGFDDILTFQNLVLVGPRGTGKTTILKLVTPTGLFHWSRRPDVTLPEIDYVPIYIPSDTTWKGESTLAEERYGSTQIAHLIQNGIFVNYCLYQIVTAIEDACNIAARFADADRPRWCLKITREQEGHIANDLSRFWELSDCDYSFLGLKLSLLKRMNAFSSFVNSLELPPIDKLHSLPSLQLLPMIRGFADVIEARTGHSRWSLNFDEMEIAPARVLRLLYESLRSFDQRVVFKFSLFPFLDFLSPERLYEIDRDGQRQRNAPVEGQDYKAIRLSGRFRAERSAFSEEIVKGICERSAVPYNTFIAYVDHSNDAKLHRNRRGTSLSRNYQWLFKSLSQKDPSFRKYLDESGVNLSNISSFDENKMAALIRKVAPLADFRDRHLRDRPTHGKRTTLRARKGYGYYHGFQQMLRISEGNPRALNFYVNDLIAAYKEARDSQTAQNTIIPKNVDRFRAMVATQVIPAHLLRSQAFNALGIVDLLARNLTRTTLGYRFHTEPPLSYQLGMLDDVTMGIIGIAVNTGALIVDSGPNDQSLIMDLHGVRVRVSHQLAPFYPLPTITGQFIIINKPPSVGDGEDQPDLLAWQTDE